jgi:flagellar biosynthesis protein FlhB
MKIHLELLVFAVLAGGLTTRLLLDFNASIALCIVSSLMVFAIVLFLLEKRYGHELDAFLRLFAKIPSHWSLTLCVEIYSYSFAMILQLPIWAVILVVGLASSSSWYWVQKRFR